MYNTRVQVIHNNYLFFYSKNIDTVDDHCNRTEWRCFNSVVVFSLHLLLLYCD